MKKILRSFLLVLALIQPGANVQAQSGAASSDGKLMVDGREAEEMWAVTAQGRFRFTVEIADDPSETAEGLMFRESMPMDHGMLFDFGESRPVQMWMKNTPLSLDMVFIAPDGTVTRIAEHTEPYSEAIIDSGGLVSHVLEINAGVSRLIGLKPGDRFEQRHFAASKAP